MEKNVKWGVLGTANIAETETIPGMLQANNCDLYAIAGRHEEKAKGFCEKFGFEKYYTSYEELLADPDVEAVYIPLPNNLHKEWILKAAKCGKHILCEKPMAVCASDAKEIVEACEAAGVLLMEAYAYLHNDITRDILHEVRMGRIGRPTMIEAVFFCGRPKETDIRLQRENYGGAAYDLGCYNISLALRLFGRTPIQVKAAGLFNEQGIDEYSSIFMDFGEGQVASTAAGMCSSQRGDRYFIYGTTGTIEANVPYNAQGTYKYNIVKGTKTDIVTKTVKSNYCLEVEQFGRCIRNGERPFVENEFSIKVAKTMDMALKDMGYFK